MGIVFGRTGVAEPVYTTVITGCGASSMNYNVRRYGTRFSVATDFTRKIDDNNNSDSDNCFRLLAGYIGVFGDPKNEGKKEIAMTAPVVTTPKQGGGTQIAMTAPVVTTGHGDKQTMEFILPDEFDSMEKIPKPTNPKVYLKEIPPATGAVHQFSGWVNEQQAKEKMLRLIRQLNDDGIPMTNEEGMAKSLLWQYHPPFTLPFLRRNEIWLELTETQVSSLQKKNHEESDGDTVMEQ